MKLGETVCNKLSNRVNHQKPECLMWTDENWNLFMSVQVLEFADTTLNVQHGHQLLRSGGFIKEGERTTFYLKLDSTTSTLDNINTPTKCTSQSEQYDTKSCPNNSVFWPFPSISARSPIIAHLNWMKDHEIKGSNPTLLPFRCSPTLQYWSLDHLTIVQRGRIILEY